MGWLLELLIDGIREICSQFIVDMMELVTGMFTELLSCDLTLFEELFSVVGDLYSVVIMPMGIAILLLILVWQLFKSMFGKVGISSEDPIELVFRSCISLFAIVAAKPIVNYILKVAGTPYQWVTGTQIKVESFSGFVSALEVATAPLGIGSLSIAILMLVMQFVVAWNYFKMLFIIAERYVLLGVFSYTSPLAFSTGGSKATNNILASWAKMFGGQVVLIVLNAWCMKMFLSGYGNLMASGYGFTKFFAATLCLVGFCKITFKMDSYLASLGVNLGRPSYGLGAMGLMMAVNRLLPHTGGSRPESSGSENHRESGTGQNTGEAAGAGAMAASSAGPIPMSFHVAGGTTGRENAAAQPENGFGEETDMRQSGETQGNDWMQESENSGALEELGVMAAGDEEMQAGMAIDADSGIHAENGMDEPGTDPAMDTSLSAGMADGGMDGSDIGTDMGASISAGMADGEMADGETADLSESMGIQESGSIDAVGTMDDAGSEVSAAAGMDSVNGMRDYPADEKLDVDTGPEMELEGGQIDGREMDTEGVACGNEPMPSGGGSHSGNMGMQSADTGTISEMGIGTGMGGTEPCHTAESALEGSVSSGYRYSEADLSAEQAFNTENADGKGAAGMPNGIGPVNAGDPVSSVRPDIRNPGKSPVEVPRSRDEIGKG